ncbi:hypothetical protein L204_105032 [Cryptococcus depauperatus]|nr:hypothetical protein L204_03678 [Cryptococcus depauperatus CBS 7855]
MASSSTSAQRHLQHPATPPLRRTSTADHSSVRSPLEQRRVKRGQLQNFNDLQNKTNHDIYDGDPLDIDSSSFQPALYYENLLAKASLKELMNLASSLSSDIGTLEGSRHQLVYNHHHQLFAAGDTIANLNVRTPQLLSVVTNLQQSFSSISQLADSVALPDNIGKAGNAPRGNEEREKKIAERNLKKLQLMIQAKERIENISEFYKTAEASLVSLSQDNEVIKKQLQDCQNIIARDQAQ